MRTLSIDPGTREMGWALWDGTTLTNMGVVQAKGRPWLDMARHVGLAVAADYDIEQVVAEIPQIYPGARSVGNPNLLIPLAMMPAYIAGYLRCTIITVKPAEWKGQVPKPACHARIADSLKGPEAAIFGECASLDARDAVGIGGFHLGRWRRGCV